MWHPAKVSAPPTAEPVSVDDAKRQCRIGPTDTNFNVELERLCKAARDHVESYCDMKFAEWAAVLECDSFADFAAFPEAPLKSVASITYTDTAGDEQTLDEGVYEEGGTRFAPSIRLRDGQAWPETGCGTKIMVSATLGGDAPDGVVHAMLMLIGHWFHVREAVNVGNITSEVPLGVEALLSNHRRYP